MIRILASLALLLWAVTWPVHAEAPVLLRVHFDPGSAELDQAALDKLGQVVPTLQAEYRWQRIEIGGHTDTTAGEVLNRDLSQRRAQAVYDFLAAQGMPMDHVSVRAYGESRPRVREVDDASRAKNRRVELLLLDNPQPGDLSFPVE